MPKAPRTPPTLRVPCKCGKPSTVYCYYCDEQFCDDCDQIKHSYGRKTRHPRYRYEVPFPLEVPKGNFIDVDLSDSSILKYDKDIFVYAVFSVPESGHYLLNSQCSIMTTDAIRVETIQYGVCNKDLSDIESCIDSKSINSIVFKGNTITNLMTPSKYLVEGQDYIAWLNVLSGNNEQLEYSKKFSNLKLLKLNI
tara:strand:+ start:2661 stop:3245 length:585 start_codon:yes stop_codon:yes gene_type:complete